LTLEWPQQRFAVERSVATKARSRLDGWRQKSQPQHSLELYIPRLADRHLGARLENAEMAILLVGIDARDLADIEDIAPVGADELCGVEGPLEIAHGAVLEECAVVRMYLDVVIGGLEVVDVFEGDDLDLAAGFYDDALLLGRRLGGGFEEGFGGVRRFFAGGAVGYRRRPVGGLIAAPRGALVEPFAEGLVEAVLIEGL